MLDQLRQIAVFTKAVEHGSFKGAAAALQLSPSVVSHHVSQLETQLGVALFYRSTRKLTLTSDGKMLLDSARSMINAAEQFIGLATKNSTELSGHLTVTLPAFMEKSVLVNHIGDFVKANPNITIELDFADSRRDIIQDGIDLAIRMGKLTSSGLKARKLSQIQRSIATSSSLLESLPKLNSPRDAEGLIWVELSPVGLHQVLVNNKGNRMTIRPKSQIKANNVQAIVQLVKNDNGIGIFPDFLIDDKTSNNNLVRLFVDWKLKPIEVYALWPPNAPKDGLTKRLVEYLSNQVSLT